MALKKNDQQNEMQELPDQRISKTQKKKEVERFQGLAKELVDMPAFDFNAIGWDEELKSEIESVRNISAHSARRRQLRYLTKYILNTNPDQVLELYEKFMKGKKSEINRFHEIETFRDRILSSDPSVIEEIMQRFPGADRQHLKNLQRNALKELKNQKAPATARILFKYLRSLAEHKESHKESKEHLEQNNRLEQNNIEDKEEQT